MATTRAREGRLEDADRAMLELITTRERVNGTNHLFTLQSRLVRLELILMPQGRFPEAAAEWMDTASRVRAHQPTLLPALARTHQGLLSRWEAAGGDGGFLEFRHTSRASVPPEGSGSGPSPVE
jgi:hypothetical protein